jgi:hypothetical protein
VIEKGDIVSIQCAVSLRGPTSVRKVDGRSLVLIDLHFPALTPPLNSSETSLQLSDNITLLAVCRRYTDVVIKKT